MHREIGRTGEIGCACVIEIRVAIVELPAAERGTAVRFGPGQRRIIVTPLPAVLGLVGNDEKCVRRIDAVNGGFLPDI